MVKCLFYILLCAMLALNLSDTPDGGLLKSQVESVIPDAGMLSYAESHYNISAIQELSGMNPLFGDHIPEYRKNKDVVPGISCSRGQIPLRLLKFNVNSVVVRTLSMLEARSIQCRGGSLFAQNNLARYSCRYYLYTLQKILI